MVRTRNPRWEWMNTAQTIISNEFQAYFNGHTLLDIVHNQMP
ncbi:MAG: hypothetical protein WCR58_07635 [Bacteroidales bacterium]|jgi:hypothetical protein|nr:hypothetical protein [Bacteroidales bacterium]MDY0369631.1 hypothetical protein [Bacteroidales bacterium]